jgi:uncharacterized membrane protein
MRTVRALAAVVILTAVTGAVVAAPAGPALAEPASRADCGWQLDTWLPLPDGYTGASVTGTGGPDTFIGTAAGSAVENDFRAVVWRAGAVTVLPTPAGFSSFANGVNRRGDVVGFVFEAGPFSGAHRPVLWRQGRMIELATPPGAEASANAINDAGLIVGDSLDQNAQARGLAWSARRPHTVRQIRSDNRVSAVSAVNDLGIAAGTGIDSAGRSVALAGTVVGGLHTLPEFQSGDFETVFDGSGAFLAGIALGANDGVHNGIATAVLWHNGQPTALSTSDASAMAVNAGGEATGNRTTDHQPVVWADGVERDLPLAAAGESLIAGIGQAITQDGTTVGGIVVRLGADFRDTPPVLWHCR